MAEEKEDEVVEPEFIEHVIKITDSANHVGLGSDFDGISDTPTGLENVGKLSNITHEMFARGFKENDIKKILGGNRAEWR